MENNLSLKINNLNKYFKINAVESNHALGSFLGIIRYKKARKLQVLNKVSLQLKKGEILGLIGKNGSGKSTLLRTISGIHFPDNGELEIDGDVLYISGLGIGLKERLSMKDNIYLLGSVMGLNRKEINKRLNDIVEFAELKEYLNTKIHKFSQGMRGRLSFSIIIHSLGEKMPDVILLDEVFCTGGDFCFEKKAMKEMDKLVNKKSSLIIASHNLDLIKRYCQRSYLIKSGQIKKAGNSQEVIDYYLTNN